jgi:hypothetical protein
MKPLKRYGLIFIVFASVLGLVTTANASPRFLKQLKLKYSTDQTKWRHTPGNQVSGLKLKLDPSVEYFYLDIMSLKPYQTINDGYYAFNISSYPVGYFEYWEDRGVNSSASGWKALMWNIINGQLPICYLKVSEGGTSYMIVDGLLKALYGIDEYLRINGDYHLGTYTFVGDIDGNIIEIEITFK